MRRRRPPPLWQELLISPRSRRSAEATGQLVGWLVVVGLALVAVKWIVTAAWSWIGGL